MPPVDATTAEDLPHDFLLDAMMLLGDEDLRACRATCSRWRLILASSYFWARRCRLRFGFVPAAPRGEPKLDLGRLYARFPAGNLVPEEYRRRGALMVKLDLAMIGCHPAVMSRLPRIKLADNVAVVRQEGRLAYQLMIILRASDGRPLDLYTTGFVEATVVSVRHAFPRTTCAVASVDIFRDVIGDGELDLRLAFRDVESDADAGGSGGPGAEQAPEPVGDAGDDSNSDSDSDSDSDDESEHDADDERNDTDDEPDAVDGPGDLQVERAPDEPAQQ
ncbi:F-box domain protein [Nile crocodilepox virus]|uniref:F-box domain protein n=1 Tax=Nile crocodilepox virus (isolate Crocodylus niloticus/Zimbabwe/Ume/2001) TaxID=1289473 RepID=Q06ZX0_CPRVZ|nr:F-box domain protein [Nile crocodilepox virus]ABJ08901.1 F-box domain protein [Nile crocodilepox virus]